MKRLLLFIVAISLLIGLGYAQDLRRQILQKEQDKQQSLFKTMNADELKAQAEKHGQNLQDIQGKYYRAEKELTKGGETTRACFSGFPFEEGIEDATFPPTCWTAFNIDADGEQWSRNTFVYHAGVASARSGDGANQNNWLVTPQITLPAAGSYVLEFYSKVETPQFHNNCHARVWISDNGNDPTSSTFTMVKELTGGEVAPPWQPITVYLDGYAGQAIYIGFQFTTGTSYMTSSWVIDDVKVYNPNAEVIDAELLAILQPAAGNNYALTDSEPVKVVVKNNGNGLLNDFVIKAECSGGGISPQSFTQSYSGASITAGGQATYTLTAGNLQLANAGTYSLTVTVTAANDDNTGNDAKTIQFTNIVGDCTVTSFPWIEKFATPVFPLDCWNTTGYWYRSDATPNGKVLHDGHYAFTPDENGPLEKMLITPPLSITSGSYVVNFWSNVGYTRFYTGATSVYMGKAKVLVSTTTNDPSAFSELYTLQYNTDIPPGVGYFENIGVWKQLELSLDAYAGNIIYLAFKMETQAGQRGCDWSLDDISVFNPYDPMGGLVDLEIVAFNIPHAGVNHDLTNAEALGLKIKNKGGLLNAFDLKVECSNGQSFTEAAYLPTPMLSQNTTDYLHDAGTATKLNLSSTGTYSLTVTLLESGSTVVLHTKTITFTNIIGCTYDVGSTLLVERFDSPAFPPACWSIYHTGSGDQWEYNDLNGYNTVGCAWHFLSSDDGNSPPLEDWLVTPSLFIPTADCILEFYSSLDWKFLYEYGGVWVSTTGNDPAANVYTELLELDPSTQDGATESPAGTGDYNRIRIPLGDYVGQTINLGFKYTGYTGHVWLIDDIRVYDFTSVDVEVVAITSPGVGLNTNLGNSEPVTVVLKNHSGADISNIPLTVTCGSQTIPATYAGTITAESSVSYTFGSLDLSAAGSHIITVTAPVPGDIEESNNSKTIEITNQLCSPNTGYPWYEDFNNAAHDDKWNFVQDCWQNLEANHETGQSYIMFNFYGEPMLHSYSWVGYHRINVDHWVILPPMALPAGTTHTLTFDIGVTNPYPDILPTLEHYSVMVSTTSSNLTNFSEIFSETLGAEDICLDPSGMKQVAVSLADYAGQTVLIAFRHHDNTVDYAYEAAMLLDNVSIEDLTTTVDGAVEAIQSPVSGENLTAGEQVIVLLKNNAGMDIVNPALTLTVNGTVAATETYTGVIAPFSTAAHTFTQTIDLSVIGGYIITVDMDVPEDATPEDNSFTQSIAHFPSEVVELNGYKIFDQVLGLNGTSLVSFPSDDPSNVTDYYDYIPGMGDYGIQIASGDYVDGYLYAYTVNVYSGSPRNFVKILRNTWEEVSRVPAYNFTVDMTYDHTTGVMYGISASQVDLVTINLSTGAMTTIAYLEERFWTLACDATGQLYGINNNGMYCSIDKSTGAVTEIAYMGVIPKNVQSMTFDQSTGRLFWTMCNNSGFGKLMEIEPVTGAIMNRGDVGVYGDEISALYTYQLSTDLAEATVEITPNTYTYNGSPITPSTITVVLNGATLVEGTDYSKAVTSVDGTGTSAGTNPGTVTLTFTGINTYSGTITGIYSILPPPNTSITVTVNGATAGNNENSFYAEVGCDDNTAVINIDVNSTAVVTINGSTVNPATVAVEDGENEFIIMVTANGNTESYTLTITKPVPFEQIVIIRWENTMTVINNPDYNGDYEFDIEKITWYCNGASFHTGQSTHGISLPAGEYYVEAYTTEGKLIRTCTQDFDGSRSMAVRAYPNPVGSGQVLYIDADMDENLLQGATIDVYSITGARVDQIKVQGRLTSVTMSNYVTGAYIFVLNGKDGLRYDLKVVVQ